LFDINIKARIKRHSRIFKDNILNKSHNVSYKWYWYNIVILVVIFIVPIYPAFASLVYTNTSYDFYRWNIDESSIIDSYVIDKDSDENWVILESKNSFLSVNTISNNGRDLSWTNEIVIYDVKNWESIWSISNKFEVSKNSILWANGFSKDHIIHPWDKIKIPPVSWLIHYVQKWETLASIALKYWIDKKEILEQNLLTNNDLIVVWDELVIPWAIKKEKIDTVLSYENPKNLKNIENSKNTKSIDSKKTNLKDNKKIQKKSNWKYVESNEKWTYSLRKRSPMWKFYWWNCTRYVAQYKNVDWSWNAKDWLRNARSKWHKTSSVASVWSIVVFSWRWYNPVYWHVWIVTWISWGNLIISDMNYRRLWEVTSRKVSIDDWSIRWYINVD
jgi:LysM repeat protein